MTQQLTKIYELVTQAGVAQRHGNTAWHNAELAMQSRAGSLPGVI